MNGRFDSIVTYLFGCCGLLVSVTLADINEILNFVVAVLSIVLLVARLIHDSKTNKKKKRGKV